MAQTVISCIAVVILTCFTLLDWTIVYTGVFVDVDVNLYIDMAWYFSLYFNIYLTNSYSVWSLCFVKGVLGGFSFLFCSCISSRIYLSSRVCVDEVRVVFVERFCHLAHAFEWGGPHYFQLHWYILLYEICFHLNFIFCFVVQRILAVCVPTIV
jgi:hypothetical protein